jgi:hypothetical protein
MPADLAGFFTLNDNSSELGVYYVANMQFRSDALSSLEIAALGGPAAGPIPVPEPGSLMLLAAAATGLITLTAGRSRLRTRARRT